MIAESEQILGLAAGLEGMPLTEATMALSERAGISEHRAEDLIRTWDSWGLLSRVAEQGRVEVEVGIEQFVADPDQFNEDVLRFLPETIRNLWSRKALLRAGTEMVGELRATLERDDGLEPFRVLLPGPLKDQLDRLMAINLFAAAVALMTNLSRNAPASSVAEEISAVNLAERAQGILERWQVEGLLSPASASTAASGLGSLFSLFDDDPQTMLSGEESGSIADREWIFRPVGEVPVTGYLRPRP